jgi:hypothetical protein
MTDMAGCLGSEWFKNEATILKSYQTRAMKPGFRLGRESRATVSELCGDITGHVTSFTIGDHNEVTLLAKSEKYALSGRVVPFPTGASMA